MKLLIIAGFLGSGKTTLLLEVARKLAAASQRHSAKGS
jgi:G3E family GTPase